MSSNAIAFVAGLGSGYLSSQKDKEKQKRDDEDRALRNEASQLQINAAKKQVSDQQALAQAGAPLTMTEGAGGMVTPETMDNRDVGLPENAALPDQGLQQGGFSVGGKSFASRGLADTELAAQNAPAARSQRVIAAMSGIDPMKALDLEQTQTQRGRETVKFTQEQETYAKKLKDEGAIDALKALRTGDGAGMVAAFNKSGDFQIQGEPVLANDQRDIPGVGTVPTYSATFNVKGKDGIVKPMTVNSHDLGMSLMPYEKWFDAQLKGAKEGRENRETDSKIGLQGAQTRAWDATADLKNSTQPKSGYERMSEFDKADFASINREREKIDATNLKAQAEGTYNPNSPGAKSMAMRVIELETKKRNLQSKYGDAPGQGGDELKIRPATVSAPGAAAAGDDRKIPKNTQSARDATRADILENELRTAQTRLAAGDTRAQGDVDALNRELGRARPIASGGMNGKPQQSGTPVMAAPIVASAGVPAALRAAAPAAPAPALNAPAQPVLAPAVLESRMQAENVEMGNGKRMQYSPEVKAYVDQKRAEKDAADIAASEQYRNLEAKKAIAASKGRY